jgi:hypothetical protein
MRPKAVEVRRIRAGRDVAPVALTGWEQDEDWRRFDQRPVKKPVDPTAPAAPAESAAGEGTLTINQFLPASVRHSTVDATPAACRSGLTEAGYRRRKRIYWTRYETEG